jgi:small-conductance mechanosensitive channel
LRTTRIESRRGSEVIVPNNKISNETIENISLEKFRRIDKIIFISNDVHSDKLNLSVELINNVLSGINDIDRCRVGLHDFNEFSFGIRIVYHINKMDNYIHIQNEVNQDIIKNFISNDIKFPSRIIVQQ